MSNESVIVYRSRAVFALSDVDLFYLLAHSRESNKVNGITGVILYDRGHFFQWLEGTNQQLGRLWNKVRADKRHTDIAVLADQQVPVRLFEGWSMQFAHRDQQHESIVDGFVVADPALLDDLHINANKVPNILASFSKLGGSFRTVDA
ncbi:MAG: BLUF domain-containing protein [Burkholderiaceae bacterium]